MNVPLALHPETSVPASITDLMYLILDHRVSTRPRKPGKMRVHLENQEISWNFEKFNKYHGKMTRNLEKLGGY